MLLDELDRRAALEYQTARLAQAVGSEVEVPDIDDLRSMFDARLCAPPPQSTMDSDGAAIRYALGIGGQ